MLAGFYSNFAIVMLNDKYLQHCKVLQGGNRNLHDFHVLKDVTVEDHLYCTPT